MEKTLERATEEGLLFQDEVPSTECLRSFLSTL